MVLLRAGEENNMKQVKVRFTTTVTVDIDEWASVHGLQHATVQQLKASVRASITDAIANLPVRPTAISDF